ncbi:MAG TPA: ATP-dependent Clp protease ATP-binding subunit, partial [Candidatus Negativibacillus faecipullorum]|nr:ATP-dependent Clp protease ATP-binding subunit [Candidatus Negativibacillus faecipullorum]
MFRFKGFSPRANDAINLALSQACLLGHTYIGSEHLLLGLLLEGGGPSAALTQKGVTPDQVLDLLIKTVGRGIQSRLSPTDMTPRCRHILEQSLLESKKDSGRLTEPEHILLAMLREKECYALRFLMELGVEPLLFYQEYSDTVRGFSREGTPGQAAARKNTPRPILLEKFGRDLTEKARCRQLDPVIGREKEIDRVVRILSRRSKNNPCLIGEAGVGKTAIAEGLAQRIAQGRVPKSLQGKRLIALDLVSMVAGTKYRGEFEERVKNMMDEAAAAQDIILFIDEIHNIIGAGAAEGSIDAANILKPQLSRGEIQLMGATTVAEYRRYIEKDSALERRFQSVLVEEPSDEESVQILRGILPRYEQHHGVKITEEAVQAAVRLSRRYLPDRFLPDKAIDLMDEAAAQVSQQVSSRPDPTYQKIDEALHELREQKQAAILRQDFEQAAILRDRQNQTVEQLALLTDQLQKKRGGLRGAVTARDIAQVVSESTGIQVSSLMSRILPQSAQSRQLLGMEQSLSRRVVGQQEAVHAVCRAIRRARVGLNDPRRPYASFLFLGPTGVGKTELCKALAEELFGSQDCMIRLDMSEYMEKHSVARMIGSPPGYVGFEEGGQLTDLIRRRPYSVVLLDEVEKAHPDVLNLLLQILEDGSLKDSQGRRASFQNAVIIMTSNIGARYFFERSALGFTQGHSESGGKLSERTSQLVLEQLRQSFSPEFLNRIDETILFYQLGEQELDRICQNLLA